MLKPFVLLVAGLIVACEPRAPESGIKEPNYRLVRDTGPCSTTYLVNGDLTLWTMGGCGKNVLNARGQTSEAEMVSVRAAFEQLPADNDGVLFNRSDAGVAISLDHFTDVGRGHWVVAFGADDEPREPWATAVSEMDALFQ